VKTHLDLFSGIGGFALACRWVGIKTVQFVEIDEFCQKVLKKNFKGVPIHEDIKSFRADGIVSPFLLTGGWPCQPFSQAGKRLGKADPRHLWPEMLRITRECRPTWILGENVSGHIKLGLEEVLTDLEGEGYDSQVFHIGAVAKDAPHRRMRLWIVAHSNSGLGNRERKEICTGRNSPDNGSKVVADSSGSRTGEYQENLWEGQQEKGRVWTESNSKVVADSDSKRRCLRKTNREDAEDVGEPSRCEENWEGELESRLGGTLHDGVSERLDQDWWIDEPLDIPRVGEKIPDRVKRLKAIGNAIVPKLAYEIIRWMR
tara:strand:+ start:1433 stop:2380 length:948 start_codon:yes stop_codon:yes gene_type:complete